MDYNVSIRHKLHPKAPQRAEARGRQDDGNGAGEGRVEGNGPASDMPPAPGRGTEVRGESPPDHVPSYAPAVAPNNQKEPAVQGVCLSSQSGRAGYGGGAPSHSPSPARSSKALPAVCLHHSPKGTRRAHRT